ncbi:hypothetical protein FHR84_001458 [Actinopolyspora biskrensis]|uniref:Uncharacterized protein n=1 Tax=Actinopolyspora biskrensis TaxID=1470178 RepID=A0A852Z3C9_9ACTN|nr:hypothetical protein [Actinopolyspora biskrensis]NYH78136.1 hypothetical protein [Actinopolyspora biskrensis]
MTGQATDECATLPREAREEIFGGDGSGPREAPLERQDEFATPEPPSVGREDSIPAEQDERDPVEQGPVDQDRDYVEAPPGARSLFAAVLAEIGSWRADVLK